MKSVLYKFEAEMPSGRSAEDVTRELNMLFEISGERFDFESLRD